MSRYDANRQVAQPLLFHTFDAEKRLFYLYTDLRPYLQALSHIQRFNLGRNKLPIFYLV